MKTLVELFDASNFNNLLGAYIFRPDDLVVIVDKDNHDNDTLQFMIRYMDQKLHNCTLHLIEVNMKDFELAKRTINSVFDTYTDAVIDITGSNTMLLAMCNDSINTKKINVITYNDTTKRYENVFGEELRAPVSPSLSVAAWLEMRGAKVTNYGYNNLPDIDAHFKDIQTIWQINQQNYLKWNKHTAWLQAMNENFKHQNIHKDITMPHRIGIGNGNFVECSDTIVNKLAKAGIITHFRYVGKNIVFRFKDEFVKDAMFTAGIWLELYVYSIAKESGYFDDVHVSCSVDWDGVVGDRYETRNEIDVVIAKGTHNAFISCKTCSIETNMLNEISMLRDNLGSPYTKAAIVSSYQPSLMKQTAYERANDLNVMFIDGHMLNKELLLRKLKELVD